MVQSGVRDSSHEGRKRVCLQFSTVCVGLGTGSGKLCNSGGIHSIRYDLVD